ncbi:hypothetical protein ACFL0V_04750 [Nanoarchaeota archaeon]
MTATKKYRILKNKKAIMAFNALAMIPRIIFLVIALLACVIIIRLMLNVHFNTADIQAELLIQGLLYGPGGITYYDPLTGRIYPEIIDIHQLNDSKLNMGFNYPENTLIGARIFVAYEKLSNVRSKLGKLSEMPAYTQNQILAEAYYNKETYENLRPLAENRIRGLGRVHKDTTEMPTLFRGKDGLLYSAFVYITILQPS